MRLRANASRLLPTVDRRRPMPKVKTPETFNLGRALLPATARSAYLVLLRDPVSPATQFLAFGFDPTSGTNLFSLKVAHQDFQALTDQWKQDYSKSSSVRHFGGDSVIDGIGTKPPPGPPPAPVQSPELRAWALCMRRLPVGS